MEGEKTQSHLLNYFREIVLCDTEFRSLGDGLVSVRCVCALELNSGKEHRLWIEGGEGCPYQTGEDVLFVAHYASAECISHQSLSWPIPTNILDTCIEFSALTCGKRGKGQSRSLVGALTYYKLSHIESDEKQEMRELAMADKPNSEYSEKEREALIDYCWSDIESLKNLLPKLEPSLCC